MLGAAALGAAAVNPLHAQGSAPGAYAIIDINSINDPDLFKTLLPKTAAANAAFGGKNVAVTENIVGLEGTPPKRFVIVAFDSMDKAKAWYDSPHRPAHASSSLTASCRKHAWMTLPTPWPPGQAGEGSRATSG